MLQSRRLYDIANVLKSLGLIEKIKNSDNKNVYRWIGSEGFTINKKQDNKKHFLSQANNDPNHTNNTLKDNLKDKFKSTQQSYQQP